MGKVPQPNIQWRGAHPNNFTVGRAAARDGGNTYHHVVGSAESAVLVFNQANRGASSTLVITDRADIAAFQCVRFEDTSYADANWDSNVRSITMEHHGDWRNGYRNQQVIDNSIKVVAWMMDQGMVSYFKRHRDVSRTGTVCPADLPVEEIWQKAKELVAHYNNVDNRPDWLKNRQPANKVVYSHVPELRLINLNDVNQLADSRVFARNTSFQIGSYTDIGGVRYLITKSSTDANIANGIRESEVGDAPWVQPSVWAPLETPRKLQAKEVLHVINLDTNQPVGAAVAVGTDIAFVEKKDQNGTTYLRSQWANTNGKNWGVDLRSLKEIDVFVPPEPPVVTPPVVTTPDWADSLLVDEDNVTMYVLRATPLIDLENGQPVRKDGKEIWYNPGDIIEDVSAHTIINEKTYRLTEYSFQEIKGKRISNANGILANDLSLDPLSTPGGTPANPEVPKPEDDPVDMPDVPTDEPATDGGTNTGGSTMDLAKVSKAIAGAIAAVAAGFLAKALGTLYTPDLSEAVSTIIDIVVTGVIGYVVVYLAPKNKV